MTKPKIVCKHVERIWVDSIALFSDGSQEVGRFSIDMESLRLENHLHDAMQYREDKINGCNSGESYSIPKELDFGGQRE